MGRFPSARTAAQTPHCERGRRQRPCPGSDGAPVSRASRGSTQGVRRPTGRTVGNGTGPLFSVLLPRSGRDFIIGRNFYSPSNSGGNLFPRRKLQRYVQALSEMPHQGSSRYSVSGTGPGPAGLAVNALCGIPLNSTVCSIRNRSPKELRSLLFEYLIEYGDF